MKKDSKRLKQAYKLSKRPLGVFLIRNTVNDKVFLAAGLDLQGTINRHKFQLSAGRHSNRSLQKDWDELGSQNFAFEVLDQMEPLDNPSFDSRRELEFMEDMWLEKLKPFGDHGYNERKLSAEERLRRISVKRHDGA